MSVPENIPYRPWCEDLQERPVDFSIKKKREENSEKVGGFARSGVSPRLRTPDSGFSSPSGNDFLKRHLLQFSSNQEDEQTVPLSLVKKRSVENDHEVPRKSSPVDLPPKIEDSRYYLPPHVNSLQLLSSALYWKQRQDMQSVPSISSLVSSAYDLNFNTQTLLGSAQKEQYVPVQTTPSRSMPRSPESLTPVKRKTPRFSDTPDKKPKSTKKSKASRRLTFDEDKTSPVSGTIIRELEEGEEPMVIRKGDIDPEYNFVEVTEEAKQELSKIENKIGDYVCRLCKELYDDAFCLAQHRCSRIIHVEYRCPECDKVFNCPANLASHRRWHKPKGAIASTSKAKNDHISSDHIFGRPVESTSEVQEQDRSRTKSSKMELPDLLPLSEDQKSCEDSEGQYECTICLKKFKRNSYLRKHMGSHHPMKESEENPPKLIPFLPTFDPSTAYNHHLSTLAPMLPSPPFSRESFHCRLCPLSFLSAGSLHLHTSTVHGTDIEGDVMSYTKASILGSPPSRLGFSSLHHHPSQILAPS